MTDLFNLAAFPYSPHAAIAPNTFDRDLGVCVKGCDCEVSIRIQI